MSKLTWDDTGKRFYETGVDHGVLYPQTSTGYGKGVAWNGLVSVTEKPKGGESNPQYADNMKYLDLRSAESFEGTIEAFTYPDEFMACDGSAYISQGVVAGQQSRQSFGLVYRTKIGSDLASDLGYKLHILYGLSAAPTEKQYQTINDSPSAITFSWDITSTPAPLAGKQAVTLITIDSTKVDTAKLKTFEDTIFGGDSTEAKLPTPDEIISIFGAYVQPTP